MLAVGAGIAVGLAAGRLLIAAGGDGRGTTGREVPAAYRTTREADGARAEAEARARAASGAGEDEVGSDEIGAPLVLRPGDLPERLSRRDLERGLDKVRPRIQRCEGKWAGDPIATVRLVITTAGAVRSVELPEELKDSELGRCVTDALRSASFPRFRGNATLTQVEWILPLRLPESR